MVRSNDQEPKKVGVDGGKCEHTFFNSWSFSKSPMTDVKAASTDLTRSDEEVAVDILLSLETFEVAEVVQE